MSQSTPPKSSLSFALHIPQYAVLIDHRKMLSWLTFFDPTCNLSNDEYLVVRLQTASVDHRWQHQTLPVSLLENRDRIDFFNETNKKTTILFYSKTESFHIKGS